MGDAFSNMSVTKFKLTSSLIKIILCILVVNGFLLSSARAESLKTEFLSGEALDTSNRPYKGEMTIISKKFVSSARAIVPMLCTGRDNGEQTTREHEIMLGFAYRKLDTNGKVEKQLLQVVNENDLMAIDISLSRIAMSFKSTAFIPDNSSQFSQCLIDFSIPLINWGRRITPVYFGETSAFSNDPFTRIDIRFDKNKIIDLRLSGTVVCTRSESGGYSGIQTSFDLTATPQQQQAVSQDGNRFSVYLEGPDSGAMSVNGLINRKKNIIKADFYYQQRSYYHENVLCQTYGTVKMQEGDAILKRQ